MRLVWLAPVVAACTTSSQPAAPAPAASPVATGEAPAAVPKPASPKPASPYPATERRPVTDSYGDVKVVDDYRWLEDGGDPGVRAWTAAQNQLMRSRIDALPDRPKIHARVSELLSNRAPIYGEVIVFGSGRATGVLAFKRQPPKQQPLLVVLSDPADLRSERVVLDPNELDPSGKTAIDVFVPTRDGKLVGVSLSTGGSESGDVHVYEVATGRALPDVVPRVHGGTAGGNLAWNADGTGFWYTRYPHDGERPAADLEFYQQVYFHKLGAPTAADTYVFGKDLPRIAEVELRASPDGRAVLADVRNGDGGEHAFYVIEASGVAQLSRFEDQIVAGRFGPDGALYLISHRGTPKGAIVRLGRPYVTTTPVTIVPEGDAAITELAATGSRLFVIEMLGGPSRLRSFRLAGGKATAPQIVATPFPTPSIEALRPIGSDDVLYLTQSYTAAPGWYRYQASASRSAPTAMRQDMTFAMDDVEVVRETCKSADGTAVPLNILRKRGIALDGSHPTMLYGYGGYNISLTPVLRPLGRLWLDQGGVYAEANLRGGGEFGETWHDAGRLANKQHVFDDFHACAQALVALGYTRPEHLAIWGRSNGGLLMGATLTQHPEMARVVVSGVGVYDMLRVELTPNGAFNVTEFGTVKEPALFRALYAYSPYHRVVDGVAYPAVLLTTGANDPRVDPYNSRKLAARLQAASSSGRPILLRASADVGHGMGSPLAAVIDEAADSYAFVMSELGMHVTP